MTRLASRLIAALLLAVPLFAASPDIKPDALLAHVKYLASDDMKGRADGSAELERAAEYIAEQFKAAGLQPGGKNGGWFQPFELVAGLTMGEGNQLVIRDGSKAIRLALGVNYYPLAATPDDSPADPSNELHDLPLVFAGYGLSVPRLNYDDYAGLDVSGKAVLIFSHEPQENDANSRLDGRRPLMETSLYYKASAARTRGARALIIVSDPTHQTDQANYRVFSLDPDADDAGIPVLRVRREEMTPLLEKFGLEKTARLIDADLRPRSGPLAAATLDYTEWLTRDRRTVRNVIGVLPGLDEPRGKEAIVLGAHYDHVGIGGRLSVNPDRTGEIHNGADDNASGTSAIMEIARAAAADRSRFPRSLVFVAFAGEERGLLGSAQYARDPAIPMSSTVAMLNLDMVGRSHGSVSLSGLEAAPSLNDDLKPAAVRVPGLDIKHEGPGAGRSDDSSFIERRIPAINFFTGFHSDYHLPGDDWPKIDTEGLSRVAKLALEFAAQIAERRDRPEFTAR